MAGTVTGEWIERKDPEFVKLLEGEMLEGILRDVSRVMIGDRERPKRPVVRFLIETAPGELVALLGTFDLAMKLRMEDRGHAVRIRYEGENKNVTRHGNAMKCFHVEVNRLLVHTDAVSESVKPEKT